jgi:hypothetical protein
VPRLAALTLLLIATAAHADPSYRQNSASARLIGCSPYLSKAVSCEGATSIRMGLSVTDIRWTNDKGDGVVASFSQASRPMGGSVLSQTIAAGGVRKVLGRAWVQAGPAMAIHGLGTRTVKIERLLSPEVKLGGIVGAGLWFRSLRGRHLELTIDLASTIDAELYQVTTNLTAYRF